MPRGIRNGQRVEAAELTTTMQLLFSAFWRTWRSEYSVGSCPCGGSTNAAMVERKGSRNSSSCDVSTRIAKHSSCGGSHRRSEPFPNATPTRSDWKPERSIDGRVACTFVSACAASAAGFGAYRMRRRYASVNAVGQLRNECGGDAVSAWSLRSALARLAVRPSQDLTHNGKSSRRRRGHARPDPIRSPRATRAYGAPRASREGTPS